MLCERSCGRIALPGQTRCDPCRVESNRQHKRDRADRRNSGLCTNCKQPVVSGRMQCLACIEYRAKHYNPPERRRREFYRHVKVTFGLEIDQFDSLIITQCGRCALCNEPFTNFPKEPHVDHDHKTGMVRGLLHYRCNLRLDAIEDSAFVDLARRYLQSI